MEQKLVCGSCGSHYIKIVEPENHAESPQRRHESIGEEMDRVLGMRRTDKQTLDYLRWSI